MPAFNRAKDIKAAVVGYGGAYNMGRKHLTEMKQAGMTPAAVVELDPERLKVAQDDFPGIETYASLGQMLRKSDADLITLITPHNTHAKLALQGLRAGRHMVCEKPFAITTAECDAMISVAREKKRIVTAYHNRHWDGWIMQAVKKIRTGVIGEVFRIEAHMGGYGNPGDWWRASKKISGGVLYDWGVHLLEYALQIIRDDIVEVSGYAHNGFWSNKTCWKKDTNEDESFAVVRFKGGKWVTLNITNLDANPKKGMLEITGTKGTYILAQNYEIVTQVDGETVRTSGKAPASEGWRFYKNIAAHLVKGTPLVITPEWARRPIHILDLASQSARKGQALKAKYH